MVFIGGNPVIGGLLGSRVYVTTVTSAANASSYTFTNTAIGVADATRYVVVCVAVGSGLLFNRPISGVTIGGSAATIHRQDGDPTIGVARSGIVGLAVSGGTTATIVVSVSGGTASNCAISTYALYNLRSTTPFATNGADDPLASSVATTLNIPSRGIGLAAVTSVLGSGGADPVTMSGLTADVDVSNGGEARVTAASLERMAAETARPISASGSADTRWAISVASWQ